MNTQLENLSKFIKKYGAWIIILLGIILRITVWLQNRDLIIDEANLVRNLNERSYLGLLKNLDYEQYAPPIFLLCSKALMHIFGTSEWVFRIIPLTCGIANLFLFKHLLEKFNLNTFSKCFVLFLFATGMLYVRYATEFKQYSSDITINILLILLALKYQKEQSPSIKLLGIWTIAISLAIWSSMPSIFIIASIGCYYAYIAVSKGYKKQFLYFLIAAIAGMIQFLWYYFSVLKSSINSDFLQNCHYPNFLLFPPTSASDWQHNAGALSMFFDLWAGHWSLCFFTNLLCLGIGYYMLYKKQRNDLVLLLTPLLLLIAAASLHEFTLLPRVCSFVYPLLFIVLAYGISGITRYSLKLSIPIIGICIITMNNFNVLNWISEAPKFDKSTIGYSWINQHAAHANEVYLHDIMRPQKIYYTSIHPDSSLWQNMKVAKNFTSMDNLDDLMSNSKDTVVFMHGWVDEYEFNNIHKKLNEHYIILDSLHMKDLHILSLAKK